MLLDVAVLCSAVPLYCTYGHQSYFIGNCRLGLLYIVLAECCVLCALCALLYCYPSRRFAGLPTEKDSIHIQEH